MKYIEAEKIKAEIEKWNSEIKELRGSKESGDEYGKGFCDGRSGAYRKILSLINEMKQEEPTPPGIEEESQKKGWLDYGLMMSEIGLHRYNAIHRIKEHKEQFNPLAIPDLHHVAEYYESVGVEKVCCCLQAYSKDFLFTQDEVKEIIDKEG